MKKTTLLKSMLLLCALVVGSSSLWATDVVFYTLTPATGSDNGYASAEDIVIDDVTWNVTGNSTFTPWRIGGKSLSSVDRTIFSKTAMGAAITEVKLKVGGASSITVNSLKLIVSTAQNGGGTKIDEVSATFAANSTISFKPTSPATQWAKDSYYKFVFNVTVSGSSNKYVEFSEAEFYQEKIDITEISLPSTASVAIGGTTTLTPTITPSNATVPVSWESDNEDVATVSNGVVTGVAAGTANIKAKSSDDASIYAVCTVTVTAPIDVTGVSLDKSILNLYLGDNETLVATVAPADATNKNVSWESDDEDVAIVDDGVVTAVAPGTCVITVTTDDGSFTDNCTVTVAARPLDLRETGTISVASFPSFTGSGYKSVNPYMITMSDSKTYGWNAENCMKSGDNLQMRASDGKLTSPSILSNNGYTVTVTYTSDANMTIKIGSDTKTAASPLILKTSTTSSAIELSTGSKYATVSGITITPTPTNPSDPVDDGEGNLTITTTDNMDGWRAFYNSSQAYTVDANTSVYVANSDPVGTTITLKNIGKVIPAGVPVILKTSAPSHSMTLSLGGSGSYDETNKLAVTTGANVTSKYRLGYNITNGVGFYPYSETSPAPGIVYLDVSSASAHALTIDFEEGDVTGITEVSAKKEFKGEYFNLAGQRVDANHKGIVVVNGKKFFNK